ncbi:MAG TPA: hypothetical protein PLF40_33690, partial [Kofleriaceae bacterium]|nr:hypothetical protein [Kofleriaceae bacterium]
FLHDVQIDFTHGGTQAIANRVRDNVGDAHVRLQRFIRIGGATWFGADRTTGFRFAGNRNGSATDQAAATNRCDHEIQCRCLLQTLQGRRALTRNHVNIGVGMNHRGTGLLPDFIGSVIATLHRVIAKSNFAASLFDGFQLGGIRAIRYHDVGRNISGFCRQCQRRAMVT